MTHSLDRPAAGSPAIALQALTKGFEDRVAVDGLTFEVPRGTICGFVGPNGAGKTTTIRMLLGLTTPTSGSASVLGHSISEPAAYLQRVGAMIEGPAFYPTLSGRRNLDVLATLGDIAPARVDWALEAAGLAERASDLFKSYSLGMKQRLGIAAALLPHPELLLLDEPINGLDPAGIREVRLLLRELADAGTTVLVSSHLLNELQHICDDIVMIRKGRLMYTGPVGELMDGSKDQVSATPENHGDLGRLLSLCEATGRDAHIDGNRVLVSAPASWAGSLNREAMDEGIVLTALGAEQRTLEDTYFELTGDPS